MPRSFRFSACRNELEQCRDELRAFRGSLDDDVEEELQTSIESLDSYLTHNSQHASRRPVFFKRGVDLMSHAYIQTDRSGIIGLTNKAFNALLGLSPSETLSGWPILLLIHEADRRRFINEFLAARQRYVPPLHFQGFCLALPGHPSVSCEMSGHGVRGRQLTLIGMAWLIRSA